MVPVLPVINLAAPGKTKQTLPISIPSIAFGFPHSSLSQSLCQTLIGQRLVMCPFLKVGWRVWRGTHSNHSTVVGKVCLFEGNVDAATKEREEDAGQQNRTGETAAFQGPLQCSRCHCPAPTSSRSIPGHRALCGPREAKIRMRPPLVTGEMKETRRMALGLTGEPWAVLGPSSRTVRLQGAGLQSCTHTSLSQV